MSCTLIHAIFDCSFLRRDHLHQRPIPVLKRDHDRKGSHGADLPALPETGSLSVERMRGGMDGSDISAGDPPPEPHGAADVAPARQPTHVSFWLRELPYVVVMVLTLFGVAFASFSRQSMVGYWEFLAPVIGVLCIVIAWPHAPDRAARFRLVWTQAAHWLAFLAAMNLLLLSGVASLLGADAIGLTILTLLALGTFVAGVHIQSWQICILGMAMGLGVPAVAWIERSVLLLLLGVCVLAAIGAALWWGARGKPA
jgi:hypothetical protein